MKTAAGKLREEIEMLTKLEKVLRQQYQSVQQGKEEVNVEGAELQTLRTAIAVEEDVARRLAAELEALQLEGKSPPRVRLFQPAVAAGAW